MGASKVPLYAYVDETGNTGHNLFDAAQPDFFTAAMITKGDFDLTFAAPTKVIAQKLGTQSLHGKEPGLGKLESAAPDLLQLLYAAKANFFVSRVEKKYRSAFILDLESRVIESGNQHKDKLASLTPGRRSERLRSPVECARSASIFVARTAARGHCEDAGRQALFGCVSHRDPRTATLIRSAPGYLSSAPTRSITAAGVP